MTDPLHNPPPAVLKFLNERARPGPDGAAYFVDDDGHPILDTRRSGCPNADARAAAMWSRSHKPELWKDAPASSAETVAASPGDMQNLTSVMIAVREGRLSADRAVSAHFAARAQATASPTASKTAPVNMTELMIAARNGDAVARARLDATMKQSPAR